MERRFWVMARAWTRFARRAGGAVKPPSLRMCSGALIRILSFSRSRRIAPVVSVQPEHAVDGVQFGWLDEFRVRNGDCEQRAFECCFPEREEVL